MMMMCVCPFMIEKILSFHERRVAYIRRLHGKLQRFVPTDFYDAKNTPKKLSLLSFLSDVLLSGWMDLHKQYIMEGLFEAIRDDDAEAICGILESSAVIGDSCWQEGAFC